MHISLATLILCINPILYPCHQTQININKDWLTNRNVGAGYQTLISHMHSTGYEVKETISEGIGRTYEEASINAGENALKELSGMYINSRTSLYKDYSIDFGGSAEIKNIIRFDTSYYNDGEIKSFETLNHINEDGMHKVIAKVKVWIGLNKLHLVNPLLNPLLDNTNHSNQKSVYVQIEGTGRGNSYESAIINALKNSISQISTKIAESPKTVSSYQKISFKIGNIMPVVNAESKKRLISGVSIGSKGIIESWKLLEEKKMGNMIEVKTKALVKLQDLNHYLNHVR